MVLAFRLCQLTSEGALSYMTGKNAIAFASSLWNSKDQAHIAAGIVTILKAVTQNSQPPQVAQLGKQWMM